MIAVRILEKGLFGCFDAGLTGSSDAPVNVEVSAVVWDGHRLAMASDKNVPGEHRSPVFALDCVDGRPQPQTLRYYTADLIRNAEKYEDFALTVGGTHIIATTGFDRVDGASSELHHYNRLLVWPVDAPDAPRLVAESEESGVRSSVDLRADLAAELGAPYYKVEGLATIPGRHGGNDRLLFGIREVGDDHENFDYVCRVVAVPYRMEGEDLVLTGEFEVVYDFDPSGVEDVRFAVGLSSLEHDPVHDGLYLLTRFEVEDEAGAEQVGAYLGGCRWTTFSARRDPALVRNESGGVFEFVNKAEGVALLGDGRLFVVYDPDRALELESEHPRDTREPHEAPYTLLTLV